MEAFSGAMIVPLRYGGFTCRFWLEYHFWESLFGVALLDGGRTELELRVWKKWIAWFFFSFSFFSHDCNIS